MSTPSILVVDDDPSVLSAVIRGLRIEGYRPRPAEDGAAALSQAQLESPSVVILDVMLPDVDGLQLCRQLRQLGEFPILMLTAHDGVSDRVAGLDSGADDYLVKPFAMAELLKLFLRHPRRVLRRVTIFERVWGFELLGDSNIIDVTIKNLRRRLEEGGEPRLIQTAHRAGYALRDVP